MAQVFLNLLVLNIDGTSFGNWSSEEENVRLWLVQHVMNPTQALLNTKIAPLRLRHKVGLGDELGQVLWQHHVTVLVLVISVLVTIVDVVFWHLC